MIYLIFPALFMITGIIAAVLRNWIVAVTALVILIISILVPVAMYTSNIAVIADLEAFYTASSTNFEISRDDTASYLSEEKISSSITLIPIYGSIERQGIGSGVANRIVEYRNTVNLYNSAFAKYRAYKNNILFSLVYPDIPNNMKLLVINPVQNSSPNNYKFENQGNVGSTEIPVQAPNKSANQTNVSEQLKQIQDTLNQIKK